MKNAITLGSLFDGLGAFPLAAVRHGITPVWASEIEKVPIAISKRHFPGMAHLGDITKIDGGKIPPVDIVTFGSPCQDLSLAGRREGLDGTRSGLFLDAVRIIRGMRSATGGNYPRFAVWENVPGAFSSNKGEDFRRVLQELAEAEIPMPGCGKWANAGMVKLAGREIAWRVLDAQYWGVPQRRRRIFLVGYFRGFGHRGTGEILFEPEVLPRDVEPGNEAGESPPAPIGGGGGGTDCLTSWDSQSRRVFGVRGVAPTLSGCDGCGGRNPAGTVCYDARGNGGGLIAPAMVGGHNGRISDYTAIVAAFSPKATASAGGNIGYGDKSPTLRSAATNTPAICVASGQASAEICEDKAPTLNCLHEQPIVCWPEIAPTLRARNDSSPTPRQFGSICAIKQPYRYILRRLTPLECERLMGLPDGWTDGHSDTARYKAIGNSVAVPCAEFIMKRIAEIIEGEKQ
jgi:DNA (cytosine-5)-methyltransferase 1